MGDPCKNFLQVPAACETGLQQELAQLSKDAKIIDSTSLSSTLEPGIPHDAKGCAVPNAAHASRSGTASLEMSTNRDVTPAHANPALTAAATGPSIPLPPEVSQFSGMQSGASMFAPA